MSRTRWLVLAAAGLSVGTVYLVSNGSRGEPTHRRTDAAGLSLPDQESRANEMAPRRGSEEDLPVEDSHKEMHAPNDGMHHVIPAVLPSVPT